MITVAANADASSKRGRTGHYAAIYIITLLMMIPLIWMVLLSFRTNSIILDNPFSFAGSWTLENYTRAFNILPVGRLYTNTFIIVAGSILFEVLFTFMSSYALARLVFKSERLKNFIYINLLFGLAIPPFILLFPVYRMTIEMKLLNTHLSLMLPYIATAISFNTLVFFGFFRGVPKEIEEAAIIDGTGLYALCRHVVFPITVPVVTTVFIFNVLFMWNEYPFAVTLLNDQAMNTIALGVSQFKGQFSIDYGGTIAASTLFIIPQLVFFAFFQKYIIDGMTAGAVKG